MVPQSRSPAFLGFLNVSEKSMYSVVTYPETSLGRFMEPLNDGRAPDKARKSVYTQIRRHLLAVNSQPQKSSSI
jgi:hypothetical protein